MVQIPTEAELSARIQAHLARQPGRADVVLAWDSYISALVEWGVIDPGMGERLSGLLPEGDRRAVVEIMLGDYAEEHPSLGRQSAEAKVA